MLAAGVAHAQPVGGGTPLNPSQPLQERRPEEPPIEAPAEFEVYEGRLIREIVLREPIRQKPAAETPTDKPADAPAEPAPNAPATPAPTHRALDESLELLARNHIRSRVGGPYTQRIVTEDITRLNRLGKFREIENRVQLQSDGSVILFYDLVPQPTVVDVQVVGNTEITDQDLLKEVDILVGTQVDPFQLDRGARRIEEAYRAKGYYLVSVSIDQDQLDQTGIVLFKIREGRPIKVTKVQFEGNRAFRSGLLDGKIETTEAWLLDRGKLDDVQLDADVAALVEFYKGEGYLDVRADRTVRPSPDGREAIVTFVIDEGPLYTLRSVKTAVSVANAPVREVTDADKEPTEQEPAKEGEAAEKPAPAETPDAPDQLPRFTAEQLAGLMPLKPGAVYRGDLLKKSEEEVKAAYGKLGYTDVQVRVREMRSVDSPEVDLLLLIDEGRAFTTGEVQVIGNELTRRSVILRQMEIKPGRPLDSTAVRESERRLLNLNLFDSDPRRRPKVTIQPEDPENPGYRDVTVEVAETNTGSIELGGAIGSDSGVVGRIGLTQRNFDITDTPDSWDEFWSGRAFRGDGQTFRIQALPGDRSQTFVVSLADPSLASTDYSGSGSAYYRRTNYREYDEQRYGFTVAAGRRFGTRWTGSIPLRVENVELSGIEPDQPQDYFDAQGPDWVTGLGIQLNRNSLDDSFRPTKGSTIELKAEQVGALGGDYNFTSLRGEYGIFIPVAEDYLGRRTVLNLNTRIGYITGDPDDVPVYERLYLGGRTFRGFGFRAVSPIGIRQDTGTPGDDPVGGLFSFFFGPELEVPVYDEMFSMVFFVDTGTVNSDVALDPYRVSAGIGFRFYVRQLSPAPLAFDFGVPIVREDTDRKRLFTFTIDLPF